MHQINNLRQASYTFVIFLICLLTQHTYAQEESITYSTSKEEKMPGHKYSDIDQYEQKFLLKANLNGIQGFLSTGNGGVFINSIGAEYKIMPSLSVDVEGMFPGVLNPNEISWLSGGLRYYPAKRAGSSAKNDRVNNFSGNYLRIGYGTQIDQLQKTSGLPDGYELSVGRQQKVGKWGYLDVSAILSYNRTFGIFTFNTRMVGGIGYGWTKNQDHDSEEAPQETEISWDRPVISMDYLFIQASRRSLSTGASFSGQFHLGHYWVIIPSISASYVNFSYLKQDGFGISNPESFNYAGSLTIRKFLGVKKRLQTGRKAKSFSGFYAQLSFQSIYDRLEFWEAERFESLDRNGFNFQPYVGVGLQEKVGDRFLIGGGWSVGYSQFNESFRVSASVGVSILLHQ